MTKSKGGSWTVTEGVVATSQGGEETLGKGDAVPMSVDEQAGTKGAGAGAAGLAVPRGQWF